MEFPSVNKLHSSLNQISSISLKYSTVHSPIPVVTKFRHTKLQKWGKRMVSPQYFFVNLIKLNSNFWWYKTSQSEGLLFASSHFKPCNGSFGQLLILRKALWWHWMPCFSSRRTEERSGCNQFKAACWLNSVKVVQKIGSQEVNDKKKSKAAQDRQPPISHAKSKLIIPYRTGRKRNLVSQYNKTDLTGFSRSKLSNPR